MKNLYLKDNNRHNYIREIFHGGGEAIEAGGGKERMRVSMIELHYIYI
jgi:hypothetical protein